MQRLNSDELVARVARNCLGSVYRQERDTQNKTEAKRCGGFVVVLLDFVHLAFLCVYSIAYSAYINFAFVCMPGVCIYAHMLKTDLKKVKTTTTIIRVVVGLACGGRDVAETHW